MTARKPLGEALRFARVRSGLSIVAASRLSGIARSQIAALEGAKCTGCTLTTLDTLAQTYGCTVGELIGESPTISQPINVAERRVVDAVLATIRGME